MTDHTKSSIMLNINHPFPWDSENPPPVPLLRSEVRIYTLTSAFPLLDMRLTEGFKVQSIEQTRNEYEIHLRLLWESNIYVCYTITIPKSMDLEFKPSSHETPQVKISIAVLAYYEFLHQFSLLTHQQGSQMYAESPKALWQFINTVLEVDRSLAHLENMLCSPEPKQLSAPVEDVFWKILVVIKSAFHRWFRAEKLEVVLVPTVSQKTPNFEGSKRSTDNLRLIDIDFTKTVEHVEECLFDWAFYKFERQYYVKFLPSKYSESSLFPSPSFCILQLSWETNCLAIFQLYFFSASSTVRADTVNKLQQKLSEICPKHPSESVVVFSKPLRPILIRYETQQTQNHLDRIPLPRLPTIPNAPTFYLLHHYLYQKRWIWEIRDQITRDLIVELLALARLEEGYFFANTMGTFNFIKEFKLKSNHGAKVEEMSCTLQYVIYAAPPNLVICESWMEPQSGYSTNTEGLSEHDLFEKMCEESHVTDFKIISSLSTFDTLVQRLQNLDVVSDEDIVDNEEPSTERSIQIVPFSLGNLIMCSHSKLKMEYPVFSQRAQEDSQDSQDSNALLYSLLENSLNLLSDSKIQINTDEVLKRFHLNKCKVYGRIITPSNLVIACLWPHVPGEPFNISFFECSRSDLFSANKQESDELKTDSENEHVSQATTIFLNSIRDAHHRNFVKVVYTNLRENAPLQLEDFERAIKDCQGYSIEWDITEYFKLVHIREKKVVGTHWEDINLKFTNFLTRLFQRVPGTDYYCYAKQHVEEQHVKKEHVDEDEDEQDLSTDEDRAQEEEEMADFWDEDDLLQAKGEKRSLDRRVITPASLNLNIDTKTSVGIFPFPYWIQLECQLSCPSENGKKHECTFPMHAIPSLQSHPVILSSPDFVATMRIVCFTFPPPMAMMTQHIETHAHASKTLNLAQVPLQQIRSITLSTGRSIRGLLSEQILRALRLQRPITKTTLSTVMRHMKDLTSNSLSVFTVYLPFLDVRDARKHFPAELEKSNYLSLRRLDDFYFVAEDSSTKVTPLSLEPSDADPVVARGESVRDPSLLYNPINLPFWLIITYHQGEGTSLGEMVKVYFYSTIFSGKMDKSRIFANVRAGIRKVCERVNQLLLLNHMHETKLCSPLLVAGEDPKEDLLLGSESKRSYRHSSFAQEQFACRVVYSIVLPIHSRVPVSRATGALIGSALHPLAVTNRTHLFVLREKDGKVFYMKLISTAEKKGKKDNQEGSKDETITLDVYGVDYPGPDITQQLYQLLESKLAFITLSVISTLLERNPMLKLTQEDVEFIRGPSLQPSKALLFQLPTEVSACTYLQYLKQNLLQYLILMHYASSDILPSVPLLDGPELFTETSTECTFVYNYIANPKTPSPVCANIGQGIAIVRIVIDTPPNDAEEPNDSNAWLGIAQRLNADNKPFDPVEISENVKIPDLPSTFKLTLKIWAREFKALSIQNLVEQISISIKQTLYEYSLEKFLSTDQVTPAVLPADFMSSCLQVLSGAIAISTPSIQQIRADLTLPSWSMNEFASEVQDIIAEVNPRLLPKLYMKEDPDPRYYSYSSKAPTKFLPFQKMRYHFVTVGGLISDGSDPENSRETPSGTPLSELYAVPDSTFYPFIKDHNQRILYRYCFVLATITSNQLCIYTYNWSPSKCDQLNNYLNRLKDWNNMRQHLLTNILHQKMGLFHHVPRTRTHKGTGNDVIKYTLDQSFELLLNNIVPFRGTENSQVPTKSEHRPQKRRAPPPFETALYNTFPKEPMQDSIYANIADPVQRHGLQFKHMALEAASIMERKVHLHNLCLNWGRFTGSPSRSRQNLLPHLRMLLSAARALYVTRIPFLFKMPGVQVERPFFTYKDEKFERNQNNIWYLDLVDAFFKEYSLYLHSQGLESFDLNQHSNKSGILNPKMDESPLIRESFFQKVQKQGGIILARVGFEESPLGGFVVCDLYAINGLKTKLSLQGVTTGNNSHVSRSFTQSFVEECSRIQQLLRLNAFLYDFHLRKLQHFLNYPEKYPQGEAVRTIENRITLLQNIFRFSEISPRNSQNHLYSEHLSLQLENICTPYEIFSYICSNAEHYGFTSMEHCGILPALFLASPSQYFTDRKRQLARSSSNSNLSSSWGDRLTPNFSQGSQTSPPNVLALSNPDDAGFDYSVIVFMHPIPSHQLDLQFNILKTNPNNLFPNNFQDATTLTRTEELAKDFKEFIRETVSRALLHYNRDSLWKILVSEDFSLNDSQVENSRNLLTEEQFHTLLSLTTSNKLEDIDPNLTTLTEMHIQWHSACQHLASCQRLSNVGLGVRVICFANENHLIIFPALSWFLCPGKWAVILSLRLNF
eukprot:TRINITY_DN6793_c0_g1_i6.p1 TRINITY_DN6793_c0_g1~~TRINITY_DN6793_c0_g1_i6.p1  ORF type:complete len:2686 (-),score=759.04 TRINITY_DN6793_c0_g1_i6:41-6997(-)